MFNLFCNTFDTLPITGCRPIAMLLPIQTTLNIYTPNGSRTVFKCWNVLSHCDMNIQLHHDFKGTLIVLFQFLDTSSKGNS